MNHKLILIGLFAIFCTSCNDDNNLNSELTATNDGIEVVKIPSDRTRSTGEQDEYVLKFRDEALLQQTLSELEKLSPQEKLEWSNSFSHFKSANSLYEQAMQEAELLDFTEEQYYAFKEKYSDYLYFPEYEDDFGAYLPIANKDEASMVSISGKILVGDELQTIDKISTYKDLQESGQAYYAIEDTTIDSQAEAIENSLKSTTEVKVPWNIIKTSRHIEEYNSGWQRVGKGKKIQLKYGIRNMIVRNHGICFHSEVSFRKKGFLGKWYNYSSYTKIRVNLVPEFLSDEVAKDIQLILKAPMGSFRRGGISYSFSSNGSSSHDSYITVPESFYLYKNDKHNIIKGYRMNITLEYRGMNGTKTYEHTYNRSYSTLVENKTFWQSVGGPVLKAICIAIGEQIGEILADGLK